MYEARGLLLGCGQFLTCSLLTKPWPGIAVNVFEKVLAIDIFQDKTNMLGILIKLDKAAYVFLSVSSTSSWWTYMFKTRAYVYLATE